MILTKSKREQESIREEMKRDDERRRLKEARQDEEVDRVKLEIDKLNAEAVWELPSDAPACRMFMETKVTYYMGYSHNDADDLMVHVPKPTYEYRCTILKRACSMGQCNNCYVSRKHIDAQIQMPVL